MRRVGIDLGNGAVMAAHITDDAPPELLDALAEVGRAAVAYAEAHPLTADQIERQERMRTRVSGLREGAGLGGVDDLRRLGRLDHERDTGAHEGLDRPQRRPLDDDHAAAGGERGVDLDQHALEVGGVDAPGSRALSPAVPKIPGLHVGHTDSSRIADPAVGAAGVTKRTVEDPSDGAAVASPAASSELTKEGNDAAP